MKIIWQFVVTKSIFEAIDAGDLQKIAELTSIFKFDAFKINSDLQLSPIQAALATMNLEIIHALLPSSMTLEQNIRLWLYAARVSNPEFIYDYFFKISLLCPAQNQTIKRDFLQQLLDNECWQALEWIFAQGIQVSFFPAIDFKPKQAVVLSLFALKYGMQEQLLKNLYTYLLDAPLNFSLNKPEEQGKTIPWYLAYQEKWQLLREIFRKNPHASLNIMPIDGEYKDASILWFCAQDDRWNLLYDLLCLRTMSPLNSFVLFKAPAHNEFSLIEWVLGRAPTEKKKEIIFHILVQLMLVNPSILSNTTNDLEPNLSQTLRCLRARIKKIGFPLSLSKNSQRTKTKLIH